jgi:hypothetical protein
MEYLMMRIPEIFEQYKTGMITQIEAMVHILGAVTVAISKHTDQMESILFEVSGKRPHEHGL